MLAESIAESLNKELIVWNIKSTTKAQDGLYVYDTVQRLYDSQFQDHDVSDIKQYIKLGKLGEAFVSQEQVVLLIDEIDKADLEFPNDLLWELDQMSFIYRKPRKPSRLYIDPLSLSPAMRKKSCRMPSCAAAYSII